MTEGYEIKEYGPWDKRIKVQCGEIAVWVEHDDCDHIAAEKLAEQISILPQLIQGARAASIYTLGAKDEVTLVDMLEEIDSDAKEKYRKRREEDEE